MVTMVLSDSSVGIRCGPRRPQGPRGAEKQPPLDQLRRRRSSPFSSDLITATMFEYIKKPRVEETEDEKRVRQAATATLRR